VAEKGRQEIKPDGNRYLILDNGYRYDGNPGQADYRAIKYDSTVYCCPSRMSATKSPTVMR
jgi:lipopolysaccharide export LptBFGC system permease protein LptF